MLVFCKMGAHSAGAQPVWNNGFYFSACARCGRDLVRGAHGGWSAVPKGFKVVWRPRPAGYPDWSSVNAAEDTPLRLIHRTTVIDPGRTGLSSTLGRN
jgi:hypothetical protein